MIPVDDSFAVQILEGADHLCGVELSTVVVEPRHLLDVIEEISSIEVLHHEEHMALRKEKKQHTTTMEDRSANRINNISISAVTIS